MYIILCNNDIIPTVLLFHTNNCKCILLSICLYNNIHEYSDSRYDEIMKIFM